MKMNELMNELIKMENDNILIIFDFFRNYFHLFKKIKYLFEIIIEYFFNPPPTAQAHTCRAPCRAPAAPHPDPHRSAAAAAAAAAGLPVNVNAIAIGMP